MLLSSVVTWKHGQPCQQPDPDSYRAQAADEEAKQLCPCRRTGGQPPLSGWPSSPRAASSPVLEFWLLQRAELPVPSPEHGPPVAEVLCVAGQQFRALSSCTRTFVCVPVLGRGGLFLSWWLLLHRSRLEQRLFCRGALHWELTYPLYIKHSSV